MRNRLYYAYPKAGTRGGRAAIAVYQSGAAVRVGYAFCSPKDQFNRKTGRKMAQGRLVAEGALGSYFEVMLPTYATRRETLDTIEGLVLACGPQWSER